MTLCFSCPFPGSTSTLLLYAGGYPSVLLRKVGKHRLGFVRTLGFSGSVRRAKYTLKFSAGVWTQCSALCRIKPSICSAVGNSSGPRRAYSQVGAVVQGDTGTFGSCALLKRILWRAVAILEAAISFPDQDFLQEV